jgi:hypothetical protein
MRVWSDVVMNGFLMLRTKKEGRKTKRVILAGWCGDEDCS